MVGFVNAVDSEYQTVNEPIKQNPHTQVRHEGGQQLGDLDRLLGTTCRTGSCMQPSHVGSTPNELLKFDF